MAERPVALPPEKRKGSDDDIQRYRLGVDLAARLASEAVTDEIREIWLTIGCSYRFLLDREERFELARGADGQ